MIDYYNLPTKFEDAPQNTKYVADKRQQVSPKVHRFEQEESQSVGEPEDYQNNFDEDKALILNLHEFEDHEPEEEVVESTTFLDDVNIFPRSPGKDKNEEVDHYEQEYLDEGKKLESMALGEIAMEVADKMDKEGPARLTENPSEMAMDYIAKLENATNRKDAEGLGNIVFDADCDGLANEIDLLWYEQKVARLIQDSEL